MKMLFLFSIFLFPFYLVKLNNPLISLHHQTQLANANCVSTPAQLAAALANATPGAIIRLCNGNWQNVQLDIAAMGTENNPITIKAATQGGVNFTGDARVWLSGQYIIFDGVNFKNGTPTGDAVLDFRSKNGNTVCRYCSLQNITFDNYNSSGENKVRWVRMYGKYNEVAYCSFLRKRSLGSCIVVQRNSGNNASPDNHRIHHNYFAERRPQNGDFNDQNDQDAIRIGASSSSLTPSRTWVYNNYFHDWIGEIEVISNKSGENKFFNNTFDDYAGTLTLRHGNDCEVYNNYFFANQGEKSGGIRIIGEGHKIYNNYIQDVKNGSSNAAGGINISNGNRNPELNEYFASKNIIVAFNTIIDSDQGIRIGTQVNDELTEPIRNIVIANNLIVNTPTAFHIITEPEGNNIYEGNINKRNHNMDNIWDAGSGNQQTNDVQLSKNPINGFRRIIGSLSRNGARGNYPFVNRDVTGSNRPSVNGSKDVGAEEAGNDGANLPYQPSDVGNVIGAGAAPSGHNSCNNTNLNLNTVVISAGDYYAANNITASGTIRANETVNFFVGNQIRLRNGFHARKGSNFTAQIEPCTATTPQQAIAKRAQTIAATNLTIAPNPFTDATTISFSIPEQSAIQLAIFNHAGELVQTILSSTTQEAGAYQVNFNNHQLSSGFYFVRLWVDWEMVTRKVVVLKP